MIFDIHKSIFPIFGGGQESDESSSIELFGSASYIGDSFFITAGHTIKNATEKGGCRIGIKSASSNEINIEYIKDFELFEEIDISIFSISASPKGILPFPIKMQPLNMLDDIIAVGYPHGFDNQTGLLRPRSLKGYIVNQGPLFVFPNKPNAYELSFQCPKGLSGAPILILDHELETYISYGYIVGNTNTEIIVFKEKEVINDGKEITYEKSESTKFGIAIQASELRHYKSKFIGDIIKYLSNKDLIVMK